VLVGVFALALVLAPVAHAKPRCTHRGERVVASSPQLVVLAAFAQPGQRKVCDRRSGVRHTLVATHGAFGSHQSGSVEHVALHGQFAYAVVSRSASNDRSASLTTLNMRTARKAVAGIVVPDQGLGGVKTDVVDLLAAPHGRSILYVRNDFAAGIVVADSRAGVAFLDEGLARNFGRPRVRGSRVVWSHSGVTRSSPIVLPDRCPTRALRRGRVYSSPAGYRASAEVVSIGNWFCVRETGQVGEVDGTVTRLRGRLGVVSRLEDVRAVDLRTAAIVSGPVATECSSSGCGATVGRSGTLVLSRRIADRDIEIIAAAPGMPERQIASGKAYTLRYEDEILRLTDAYTFESFEQPLP
jgi:hypothetical protein